MKNKLKKILSMAMVVTMLLSLVPAEVFASGSAMVGPVGAPPQDKVTYVNGAGDTIKVGATIELESKVKNAKVHSWWSDNANVVKVTKQDKDEATVKGIKAGTTTIYHRYKKDGKYHTEAFLITVVPSPTGIEISPKPVTLEKGEEAQLSAAIKPEGTTGEIEWKSSNTKVATVDRNGMVTAVGKGEATITATIKGTDISDSCAVTVKASAPTGIEVSPETVTIEKYSSTELRAKILPEGATGTVVWSSGDSGIATVDSHGNVTGVSAGTTTITATIKDTGISDTCEVTVTPVKSSDNNAKFYYLKTPTSDPASNNVSQWGDNIGTGKINTTGAVWSGINCFVSGEPDRVVAWPAGYEGGNVAKDSAAWNDILTKYKSVLDKSSATKEDVESITLRPYKISDNADGYHVDCMVDIKLKDNRPPYAVRWFVWDAGATGYVQKAAQDVHGYNTELKAYEKVSLGQTKEVGGRTYRLIAWYDNAGLSGEPIAKNYIVKTSVDFYAKYVSDFIVTYDLAGGTWSSSTTKDNYPAGSSVAVRGTTPTKAGYTFAGWRYENTDSIYNGGGSFTMPEKDVTLTAQWTKDESQKHSVSAKVEYYFGDTLEAAKAKTTPDAEDAVKTETGWIGDAKTVTVTPNEKDKFTGYKYAETVGDKRYTVAAGEATGDAHIVKVYYIKNVFEYKVEYYYDGKIDGSKTETAEADYGKEITTYIDKNITGYKLEKTEKLPLTISAAAADNVIKVYYVKDSFVYKVEYRESSETGKELADAKSGTAVFDATVNEDAASIPGYTADKNSKSIKITSGENKIVFIYTANKHSVTYKITGAFFANESFHKDPEVAYGTKLSLITDDMTKVGYTFSGWSELPEIMPDEDVVVTGSYTKDETQKHSVKAQVEYYFGDTLADAKAKTKADAADDVKTAESWIGEAATVTVEPNETDKFTGYKYAETVGDKSYTVDAEAATDTKTHIVKVYYVKDDSQTKPTSYTVKHVVGGVEQTADTKTYDGTAWINETNPTIKIVAGSLAQKTYTGYKFDSIDTKAEEGDAIASGTVITLTYVRDDSQTQDTAYTVKHIVDGVEQTADTETYDGTAWINDTAPTIVIKADTLAKKSYTGYRFDSITPEVKEGDAIASGTTVELHYVKDEKQTHSVSYMVEYYKDGIYVDGDEFGVKGDAVQILTPATVDVQDGFKKADKYEGYKLDKTEPETVPASFTNDALETGNVNHVIKVYYTKRTDLSYTVNYLNGADNTPVEKAKTLSGMTFGAEAEEEAPYIKGYIQPEDKTAKITIAVAGNVINFYYKKAMPELELEKTVANGEGFETGTVLDYEIKVTNIGNVPVHNIKIADGMSGLEGFSFAEDAKLDDITLDPGQSHTVKASYKVSQEDLDKGERIVNTATANGLDPDDVAVKQAWDDAPATPGEQAPDFEVTKTVSSKDDITAAGDEVEYTVTVENTGNVTLKNITFKDTLVELSDVIESIAPQAKQSVTYSYAAVQADLDKGVIENTVTATPEGLEGKDASATVSVLSGDNDPEKPDIIQTPAMSITKTAELKDAEGNDKQKAEVGDKISYTVTVENTGNVTLSKVEISDEMSNEAELKFDKALSAESLAPGAENAYVVKAEYTVTQKDIDEAENRLIVNTASAAAKAVDGSDVKTEEVKAETPVADEEPAISVTKSYTTNGVDMLRFGDEVKFEIVVSNLGNVTLSNVEMTDTMSNGAKLSFDKDVKIGTLKPGESTKLEATYTVAAADLVLGGFDNTASAVGTAPSGKEVTDDDKVEVSALRRSFTADPLDDIVYGGVDTRELRRPVVKDAETKAVLVEGVDYELAYSDAADYRNVTLTNNEPTRIPVIVVGKNAYSGAESTNVTVDYAITPRQLILTSASAAKIYDGTPLTDYRVTVAGMGFAPGDSAIYNVTGSRTEVGESYNTFEYVFAVGTKAENYNVSAREGILTVTGAQLYTLTVNYVDGEGNTIAPSYVDLFAAGAPYFVQSPYIEGYTPNFETVESGAAGMPRQDVTVTVVYTLNAEDEAPRGEIVPDDEGFTLTEIVDDDVPLAGGIHKDCIMHFLLMIVAFIVQLVYTKKRKKYQERIFELRKKLGDPDMDDKDERK